MSDEPTLNIKGKLNLDDARAELRSFAEEAARGVGMTPRGGGGGTSRGGGLDRLEQLAGEAHTHRAQVRYAAAVDRMAAAIEKQAAAVERSVANEPFNAPRSPRGINWNERFDSTGPGPQGSIVDDHSGHGGGGLMGGLRRHFTAIGIYSTVSQLAHAYQQNSIDAAAAAGNPAAMATEAIAARQRMLSAVPFGLGHFASYLKDPAGSEIIGINRAIASAKTTDELTASSMATARFVVETGRGAEMAETVGSTSRQRLGITHGRYRATEHIREQIGAAAEVINKEHQETVGAIDARRQRHRGLHHLPDRLANKIIGATDPFDGEEEAANAAYRRRLQVLTERQTQLHINADLAAAGESAAIDREIGLEASGLVVRGEDSLDLSRGNSQRIAGRNRLLRRHSLELNRARANPLGMFYNTALDFAQRAEVAGYDFQANRDASWAIARNTGMAESAGFRGAHNAPFAAAVGMRTQHADELNRTRASDDSLLPSVRIRQQEEREAFISQTMRGISLQNAGNVGQARVLSYMLARDPLGAGLAGNELSRTQELGGMDAFSRLFLSAGINMRHAAQASLIRQQFNDGRELTMVGLQGGLASSTLRAQGRGPSAEAQDIFTGALSRATAFQQQGFGAARQAALLTGVEDLKALRRQYQFGGYGGEIAPGSLGPAPGSETRVNQERIDKLLESIDRGINDLNQFITRP